MNKKSRNRPVSTDSKVMVARGVGLWREGKMGGGEAGESCQVRNESVPGINGTAQGIQSTVS